MNPAVRDLILAGSAVSAFGAAISEAMAGHQRGDGRLPAPLRAVPGRRAIHTVRPDLHAVRSPRRAVELIITVDVVLLVLFQVLGVSGFHIWQYMGTLGTLAIMVGYALVCAGAGR